MSVRLFVLGLVYQRDIHGYEIKEVAKVWGLDRWTNIGFGSIYHALGKLQEEQLIEERGMEQEGNRPTRYIYRITEAGRDACLSLLRQTTRTADTESRDIDMALAFIHLLPPEERVALLQERLERLTPRYEFLANAMAAYEAAQTTDDPRWDECRRILRDIPWVVAGTRHSLGRVRFEQEWMREVLETVAEWPSRR
jgi:DNA-binding PadR family transcriptional regulator